VKKEFIAQIEKHGNVWAVTKGVSFDRTEVKKTFNSFKDAWRELDFLFKNSPDISDSFYYFIEKYSKAEKNNLEVEFVASVKIEETEYIGLKH
jgi:hypothetical protein